MFALQVTLFDPDDEVRWIATGNDGLNLDQVGMTLGVTYGRQPERAETWLASFVGWGYPPIAAPRGDGG